VTLPKPEIKRELRECGLSLNTAVIRFRDVQASLPPALRERGEEVLMEFGHLISGIDGIYMAIDRVKSE
jgi:hypothetical protein